MSPHKRRCHHLPGVIRREFCLFCLNNKAASPSMTRSMRHGWASSPIGDYSQSMGPCVFKLTGACLILSFCLSALGRTPSDPSSADRQKAVEDKDPIAIVELGAATSWNVTGGAATFAPNLAAEVIPIDNWLEIEAGVSPSTLTSPPSGTPICSSKSRGPCLGKQSSCLASVPNGPTSARTGK